MDEVIELRPCPYCGGKAEIAYSWRDRKFCVQCRSCGFEAVHEVLSEAFVEWENDTRWRVIAPKPAPAELAAAKRRERLHEWCAKHRKQYRDYKDYQREYWREYRAVNRERLKKQHREYYAKKKAAAQLQETD